MTKPVEKPSLQDEEIQAIVDKHKSKPWTLGRVLHYIVGTVIVGLILFMAVVYGMLSFRQCC